MLPYVMPVALLPAVFTGGKFNYFDFIAVVWLIIGLFRGRKRGMSQELLPLLQWLGIVVAGGLLYWPFSSLVRQYTQLDPLWAAITAYAVIGLGVHLFYKWFKQMFAEKLVEKDLFGRAEFYLGMMCGVTRFACMIVVALALINAHIVTADERAQTEKFQKDNFSDIRFPTYGQFQQEVLFQSFSGVWVENHLRPVLITPIDSPVKKKTESIAQKNDRLINDILSKPTK
jgi:uncharacterized membrane protein required for colicin V production